MKVKSSGMFSNYQEGSNNVLPLLVALYQKHQWF